MSPQTETKYLEKKTLLLNLRIKILIFKNNLSWFRFLKRLPAFKFNRLSKFKKKTIFKNDIY